MGARQGPRHAAQHRRDARRRRCASARHKAGDWSTAHSVQWDALFPGNESNRALTNRLTRQSYPLGIIVNRDGRRFVDEGADFRNYTYARYGRAILEQPGSIAFQIFDSRTRPLLRAEEYDMPGVSVAEAGTVEELARRIGADERGLAATIAAFNASIDLEAPFDPTIKDGRPRRGGASEEQLGVADRPAAVLRLPGRLRHHVHLRRPPRRRPRSGARPGRPPHARPVRMRRDAGRSLQRQLPGRLRPGRRDGVRLPCRAPRVTRSDG